MLTNNILEIYVKKESLSFQNVFHKHFHNNSEYLNILIIQKKVCITRGPKINNTFLSYLNCFRDCPKINITSSDSHVDIYTYMYSYFFYIQNEVFFLWLFTCINLNLLLIILILFQRL